MIELNNSLIAGVILQDPFWAKVRGQECLVNSAFHNLRNTTDKKFKNHVLFSNHFSYSDTFNRGDFNFKEYRILSLNK